MVALFISQNDLGQRKKERMITEKSSLAWVGEYFSTLQYMGINESYQSFIPEGMSNFVNLLSRYSYCDQGKGYSKKVFDRLRNDFQDTPWVKKTPYYY